MSVMLYKAPGKHKLHGYDVDHRVVAEDDVQAAIKDGWHKTPADAQEAFLKAEKKAANSQRGKKAEK